MCHSLESGRPGSLPGCERLMARKSVARILEQAADILEKNPFTTGRCYDTYTGGYCALGAIARAAYPKAPDNEIDDIAYIGVRDGYPVSCEEDYPWFHLEPRYVSAVQYAQRAITRRKTNVADPALTVYGYNDDAFRSKRGHQQVVNMLRRASALAAKESA